MWPWKKPKSLAKAGWPLEMQLARLSPADVWRLSDAVTGTIALGSTGSGKSSGGAIFFLLAMLRAGMGGLVLCVKPDDRRMVETCARQLGRRADIVTFGPTEPHRMNLLEYELRHGGGMRTSRLENVIQLFQVILEIAERDRRSDGSSGDNKYFERAALQMLRCALLVLILAGEPITLENIHRFIVTAPRSIEEARSPAWRDKSYCYQTLCKADDQPLTVSEERDFELSLLYFLEEFAAMDAKPRSSIVSTYTTMSDLFQRGVLRDTFFGETNITPDACRQGKIFVLDFPTLRWNETGRIIQSAFKFVWQRSQERHDVAANPRPVFLFSDEAQQFLTSFDGPFQATARSSRICTLYITQNLPGMYEAVGGESGRHVIDALLGNLRLKVFHAQDDGVTCQWQSELLGKTKRLLFNSSAQPQTDQPFDLWRPRSNVSAGFSESWEYLIQPWEWAKNARTGGEANGFLVDATLFQGGRVFNASGKTFLPITFDQRRG